MILHDKYNVLKFFFLTVVVVNLHLRTFFPLTFREWKEEQRERARHPNQS